MAAPERAELARLLRLLPEAAALTRAADGLLLDANEAFEELTAYHRDELLGRVVYELGLWCDPDLWRRLLQETEATGEARSRDTELRTKDGRLISVLASVSCVEVEGESCCLTTVHDFTEQKHAEELLRLERQRLQFVLAGAQQGFWDWNIRTGEVQRNARWAEMLGYTLEEIEFTVAQWTDLIHPDDRDRAWQSIQDHLEGRSSAHKCEYRMRTKQGDYRWILDQAMIVQRDPQGRPLRMSGTHTDITERKEAEAELAAKREELGRRSAAEQALRASEAAYRGLVEDINDVIYATDPTGVITYISPAIERVTGYAPSEAVGQSVESFVHPDDVPAVRRRFADLAAGRFSVNEYRVVTKNGEDRWVRVSSRPTMEDGTLVSVHGVLADITDWKQADEEARRLQAQLLQSQKLAALGEIISGIAHELNNPLAAVVAYAQLIQERDLPREAADDVGAITESALRASRVVQNLLAFARRQEPRRAPTAINEVVEGVLRLRAAHLSAGGIEVVAQLAPDLPPVLADHHQLEQVLLNLVNNAERALIDTHNRRQLTLSTEAAGDWLQLRVADTGVGIPEDLLDRIFEPFFTTREAGQGTGLGLAICHAIVTDHGGRISVSSRPGEGTELLVELPVTTKPSVAEAQEALPVASFAGLRALVVEDELLVRLPLVRMLEEMGLEVASAGNAAEALQILTGGEWEVIVCDMKMPGMDGRDFHGEVRRRWPPLARRFIVCTGDVLNPDTVAFAEAIGAPLLAKPFLVADVRAAVAAALADNGPAHRGSEGARP